MDGIDPALVADKLAPDKRGSDAPAPAELVLDGLDPVRAATGARVTDGGFEKPPGTAALRSPLRTRSVAGGSAALPADKARRRARAA